MNFKISILIILVGIIVILLIAMFFGVSEDNEKDKLRYVRNQCLVHRYKNEDISKFSYKGINCSEVLK